MERQGALLSLFNSKLLGSCPFLVLTFFSDRDLEFGRQSMELTALIFLLIPVGIALDLSFSLIPRYFQDPRQLCIVVYY